MRVGWERLAMRIHVTLFGCDGWPLRKGIAKGKRRENPTKI